MVLFKPEVAGLQDCREVESLQDQSLTMLQHQVKKIFFPSTKKYVLTVQAGQTGGLVAPPRLSTRYPRLVMAVSALRAPPASTIEKIYFEKTIGATPMKKLLCDMFKN